MYKRALKIDSTSSHSIFLFGPRGTGKTSWLHDQFPDALYFDLLQSETYIDFLANPGLLESRIPSSFKGWVIIDEVQKVPMILNEVHRLIEAKGYRFILTGSSARALRRRGVNLLAGRAFIYNMHPFTMQELAQDFNLSQALEFGMLPMTINTKQKQRYLASYVSTYLKEEVQQEALTRNLPLFIRFLTIASFSQGEELNYTSIAREAGTTRQTIHNFFHLLEDLLLSRRIPVFSKRAKRALVSKSKFYFFDVGIYRTLRPRGPLDSVEEMQGAALETLFLQNLLAINDYKNLGYSFYFWRTASQVEVDFVLYGNQGFCAVEIKRKRKLHPSDFKGLQLFHSDYPMAKCYMLYGGKERYHHNGIEVLPYIDGLRILD